MSVEEILKDPFVAEVDPTVHLDLDIDLLFQNLRNSRRGAAGGLGMTTDHWKILLDAPGPSLMGDMPTLFARGQILEDILTAVRVGRMTAMKPDGSFRGIVVGDVFSRLVARHRQAVCRAGRGCHPPFPVRNLHEGGDGVRSTHCASTDMYG